MGWLRLVIASGWQVAGREAQAYSFQYDGLDRLINAKYADIHSVWGGNTGWDEQYSTDNKFDETTTYDLRGNIQSLTRKGAGGVPDIFSNGLMYGRFNTIDALAYKYTNPNDPEANSNKLATVTDNSGNLSRGFKTSGNNDPNYPDYTYDKNGNITSDANKGITNIQYNYLNLPTKITLINPTGGGTNTIYFVYDASGQKHQKITKEVECGFAGCNTVNQTTYTYVNGIEYKDGKLQRIAHTEGSCFRVFISIN